MPRVETLVIKWSVSKGRDTYGYNICSLYRDGKKIASCNGGGYDMHGTVIGKWLEEVYQDRLVRIADRAYRRCEHTSKNAWNNVHPEKVDTLYGLIAAIDVDGSIKDVFVDGACGIASVKKIAKEIGIQEISVDKINKNITTHLFSVSEWH